MQIVDEKTLQRWRAMNAVTVLDALADFAKRDSTFAPIKDKSTTRWHATVCRREYELLLTGAKFFDTRLEIGGGGAIDFAMHLLRIDFRSAVAELHRRRM